MESDLSKQCKPNVISITTNTLKNVSCDKPMSNRQKKKAAWVERRKKLTQAKANHSVNSKNSCEKVNSSFFSSRKVNFSTSSRHNYDVLKLLELKYPVKVYSIKHLIRLSKEKIFNSPHSGSSFLKRENKTVQNPNEKQKWIPKSVMPKEIPTTDSKGPISVWVPKST